jgi:hypothetical protein
MRWWSQVVCCDAGSRVADVDESLPVENGCVRH